MATVDPHGGTAAGPAPDDGTPPRDPAGSAPGDDGQPPHGKRRHVWMWACVGLAVVAIGLAIWGASRQSALDDSQQEVAELQSQTDEAQDTGSAVVATFKNAYDSLAQQLGATNEDLDATQQDLADAQETADKAEEEAAAAKEDAAQASDQTAKASAEAEQAKAEADAAQSRAAIVKDCANAYLSAIGVLFEGDSVSGQAAAVRADLQSITDDCKGALSGS
jgi:uncharacterized membrane protein YdfJ with MMPL/SSD domain